MKLHVLRLQPGEDLRPSLDDFVRKTRIDAGFIASAVGSLSRASLRFASAPMPELIGGPLEIVALSGTLSPDGCHLHLAAANGRGHVVGGHLMPGCIVHTTAEIVIGVATNLAFRRESDPATGYRELVIMPREP